MIIFFIYFNVPETAHWTVHIPHRSEMAIDVEKKIVGLYFEVMCLILSVSFTWFIKICLHFYWKTINDNIKPTNWREISIFSRQWHWKLFICMLKWFKNCIFSFWGLNLIRYSNAKIFFVCVFICVCFRLNVIYILYDFIFIWVHTSKGIASDV